MTDVEFRAVMMTRMKEAEAERRKKGKVGNVNSEDYINNLSRRSDSETK